MACACKVSQQLSFIERKYGTKTKVSKKTDISVKVRLVFNTILNAIVVIVAAPVMLVSILANRKKVININKVFGITK